jgi:hypothetical protein
MSQLSSYGTAVKYQIVCLALTIFQRIYKATYTAVLHLYLLEVANLLTADLTALAN